MHDADARGNHFEGVERLHTPLEKLVAFAVARELQFHVESQRIGPVKIIHLHGMIDYQVYRHQRLDQLGIAAEFTGRIAHRGEVCE